MSPTGVISSLLVYTVSGLLAWSFLLFSLDRWRSGRTESRAAEKETVYSISPTSNSEEESSAEDPGAKRFSRGVAYSLVAILLWLSYYGAGYFGPVGAALRRVWNWTSWFGGTADFQTTVLLAGAIAALYAVRLFVAVSAKQDLSVFERLDEVLPDGWKVSTLNERVAPTLAGVTVVVIAGFCLSAAFSLTVWGIALLCLLLMLLVYIYETEIVTDAAQILYMKIVLLIREGLVPFIAGIMKDLTRLALTLARIPRPLADNRMELQALLKEEPKGTDGSDQLVEALLKEQELRHSEAARKTAAQKRAKDKVKQQQERNARESDNWSNIDDEGER